MKKLPDAPDGKQGGHLFVIEGDDGQRQCYGAPTLLWEIIEGVPTGTVLRIVCTGKVKTRRGQPAWTFEVRHKGQPALPF
jgi:hypothetical protein